MQSISFIFICFFHNHFGHILAFKRVLICTLCFKLTVTKDVQLKDHTAQMSPFLGFGSFFFFFFGSSGAIGVRGFQKLPLYLTEPMPAGSNMDPSLAEAEPISGHDSTSGIMHLRR